jgi:zinc transporter ZupT
VNLRTFLFYFQEDTAKIWAIFISLTVHKLIVAFSVGLQLARTHAHNLHWVVISMVLISLMTPLGGLIGMLVQNAPIEGQMRDIVILICQGLAVGTFIYVSWFNFYNLYPPPSGHILRGPHP